MSSSEAGRFVREVWGLQGVAYLVVGLRYYSRISTSGWQTLAWDDALMGLATLVYTAESVAGYFVVAYWRGLANNGMTDEQRAAVDPASEEWMLRVNGSKTHVIGLLLYTTLLWLLKGCWVVYYSRLTNGVQNMKRIIFWAAIIMPVTYVACLLVSFCKCIPFQNQWQIDPSPGNSCMPAISFVQTIFVMAMNTATDFYLMAIPLPMVWKSHLPWRNKATLMIMFSGGFIEMAFGILRCVSILTVGDVDPAQNGYWSVRESFVSFVLTNMPMVYPLFKGVIEKSRNLSTSNNKNSALSDSNGYRLGSYTAKLKQRPKSGSHPLSIPNRTKWGSDEHIVPGTADKSISDGDEAFVKAFDGVYRCPPIPCLRQGFNVAKVVAGNDQGHFQWMDEGNHLANVEKHQITVTTEYMISRATPEPEMRERGHR